MVHQTKAWTNAASKAKKEQLKAELKCQGLEEKVEAKEKELGDAHALIVQLKKEKEDAIDDYMDSDDFKKLMDAHDDILLPQQHTLGWNDALRAVLAKHPGLFAEGDFGLLFFPRLLLLPPFLQRLILWQSRRPRRRLLRRLLMGRALQKALQEVPLPGVVLAGRSQRILLLS